MNKLLFNKGVSLVEMIAALIITGTIMLGLSYTYSEIHNYFKKEAHIDDINNYGNLVLDDIAGIFKVAERVTLATQHGFRTISVRDIKGDRTYYYVDPNDGVVKIDDDDETSALPKFISIDDQTVEYRLKRFWCDPIPTLMGNVSQQYTKLRKSIFKIELEIELITSNNGDSQIKTFIFNREVFASSHYL